MEHEFKPGEFNHRQAWEEWAKPKFDCLPANVRELYERIRDNYNFLNQQGTGPVRWPTDDEDVIREDGRKLVWDFNDIPAEILAEAVPVIYAYGHWGSGWAIPNDGGAYWKFESLGNQILAEKRPGYYSTKLPEDVTKKFIVPTPAEAAVDEVFKGTEFSRHDIIHCNWDPHPFVIGPKHLERCNGILSDPDIAPCAHPRCNLRYAEHKSEKVLLIAGLKSDKLTEEQRQLIMKVGPVLDEHGIDGITFVKD